MTKLFLWIAYGVAGGSVLVFLAVQSMPPEQVSPGMVMTLPIAMLAGLVISYLHKRLGTDEQ